MVDDPVDVRDEIGRVAHIWEVWDPVVLEGLFEYALEFAGMLDDPTRASFFLDRDEAAVVRDLDGWTPLMFAARYNDADVVEFLLDAGADPAARDAYGSTAADLADEFNEAVRRSDVYQRLHDGRFD